MQRIMRMAKRSKAFLFSYILMLTLVSQLSAQSGGWVAADAPNPRGTGYSKIQFVYFFNPDEGVVAGDGGLIRYTDDGGAEWRQPILPPLANNARFTEDIHSGMRVKDTIFLLSLNNLFASTNRGRKWTLKASPVTMEDLGLAHKQGAQFVYSDVFFINEEEGWLLCTVINGGGKTESFTNYVLHTSDAGGYWETYRKLPTGARMVQMYFATSKLGWIVGEGGTILHSEDGGRSWTSQEYQPRRAKDASGGKQKLLNVAFRNGDRGVIVGRNGTILLTRNGGKRWDLVEPPPTRDGRAKYNHYGKVEFVKGHERFGWIVGSSGDILCTADGGESWERQKSPVGNTLFSINMLNRDEGWAGGAGRTLLRYDSDEDERCGSNTRRR